MTEKDRFVFYYTSFWLAEGFITTILNFHFKFIDTALFVLIHNLLFLGVSSFIVFVKPNCYKSIMKFLHL